MVSRTFDGETRAHRASGEIEGKAMAVVVDKGYANETKFEEATGIAMTDSVHLKLTKRGKRAAAPPSP